MAGTGGYLRSPPVKARTREVEAGVMKARIQGQTWRETAATAGPTIRAVQYAWDRGLARIAVPDPVGAKREPTEACRQLQASLWRHYEAATNHHVRAALAGRILACQARMSVLTGSDVPAGMAVMVSDAPRDDEATVAKLRRLSPEELRTLRELQRKMNVPEVETTAKPTAINLSVNVSDEPMPAAPDFDPSADLTAEPAQLTPAAGDRRARTTRGRARGSEDW